MTCATAASAAGRSRRLSGPLGRSCGGRRGAGPPHRPARRPARHHRAGARRALGRLRRLGRRRLAGRDRPAQTGSLALPRAPAVQGHRSVAARWTSPPSIDAVGGEMNAFTAKEYTCYYARVLDADLPLAVDVVCDMVTVGAAAAPTDVETERGVILEEIAMHDDDPGDVVHDVFAAGDVRRHPARPADPRHRRLDRAASPRARDQRLLPAALPAARTWSSPPPATSTTPQVVRLVREAFAVPGAGCAADGRCRRGPRRPGQRRAAGGRRHGAAAATDRAGQPRARGAGLTRGDERRFALGVLNGVLGGGMSSRLFQEVREKRGLAYSVYSYTSQLRRRRAVRRLRGLPARARSTRCSSCAAASWRRSPRTGSPTRSCAAARASCAGPLVLGLEDTGSRMTRIGKSELVLRRAAGRRRAAAPRSTP